jgi:hypothetical protein
MWKILDNYPNYEINDYGDVRNIVTKRMLKVRNMCITDHVMGHVTINDNGKLKHLEIRQLMLVTFDNDEII